MPKLEVCVSRSMKGKVCRTFKLTFLLSLEDLRGALHPGNSNLAKDLIRNSYEMVDG